MRTRQARTLFLLITNAAIAAIPSIAAVAIIPHTVKVTTLGLKQVGDQVNLESDLIGKYVERLLQERGILPTKPTPAIDLDYLKKRGLI